MDSDNDKKINPPNQQGARLQVKPVDGRRALRQFIGLPWSIYSNDPLWVPPLLFERRQFLSARNPYFDHARYHSWIAYRGTEPVGRISAQIDELHLQRYQDATGFFGMLEARDDPEIFSALLSAAETWLRNQGMSRIRGPFNLSVNQECGLLVDGFDTPPVLMMGHAHPYYGTRIENSGYTKVKDLLAYLVHADFKLTRAMQTIIKWASRRVRIRSMRLTHLEEDLQIVRDIFEDAWSQNWGFIPFTEEEFRHLGKDLKQLVPPDFVQIAEVEGVPAAMIVVFPNINEAIADLNGRLLPFGWLKLLWRLKLRFPQTARVPLMGVRQDFQKSRLGAALALMVIEAVQVHALRRGVKQVELSWILEDNMGMRNILDGIGGKVYKRYRMYDKELV
jgi:GNAT superfamily N-acetyltransferase